MGTATMAFTLMEILPNYQVKKMPIYFRMMGVLRSSCLSGGGRKGAAVLCELLPEQLGGGTSGRGAEAYRSPSMHRQRGGN